MCCPVMRAAKGDQVVGMVTAPFGTRLDVMKIQKQRVATAGNDTPPVIPAQHGSARRGWDGLRRARARVGAFIRHGAVGRDGALVPNGVFVRDGSLYH
jgi:hypothetical protein